MSARWPRLPSGFNPWFLLGAFFLLVGAIGVVLPLLPTTPFVLVAAACFARSSPRAHAWLLANPTFGPVIRNWERNRCVSVRVKLVALAAMLVVGGFSLVFVVPPGWVRLAGAGLIAVGCATVLLMKTCPGTRAMPAD